MSYRVNWALLIWRRCKDAGVVIDAHHTQRDKGVYFWLGTNSFLKLVFNFSVTVMEMRIKTWQAGSQSTVFDLSLD